MDSVWKPEEWEWRRDDENWAMLDVTCSFEVFEVQMNEAIKFCSSKRLADFIESNEGKRWNTREELLELINRNGSEIEKAVLEGLLCKGS